MAITRITKGVIKPNENYDTHNINSTGIVTAIGLDINGNADVSGSLSVGGVLTYEDVTSIDSVGIITARTGLVSPYADIDDFVSVGNNIHLGNAGVITATSFVGDGSGLIGVASTDNIVTGTAATFNIYPVDINAGMTVAGVSTMAAITATTGTFSGAIDLNADLDVDGHTNLDNVSVAGISSFAGIIDANNTPASIRVAQDIQHKGDADTKITFPAADQISFETGGSNRLKIHNYDSNHNVEVDASAHLSLANNGSNGRFIYIGDANASSTGYMHLQPGGGSQGFGGGIRLYSHSNSTNAGGVYIGKSHASSGAIIFGNGGMSPLNEYARIDSSGRVQIGGVTGPNNAKLFVAGTNSTNYVTIRNTSAADSSGSRWGSVRFQGTQSGGEVSDLVHLQANHEGSSDDQKGAFQIQINDGNDGDSLQERMHLYSTNSTSQPIVKFISSNSGDMLNLQNSSGGGQGMIFAVDTSGSNNTTYLKNNTSAFFDFTFYMGQVSSTYERIRIKQDEFRNSTQFFSNKTTIASNKTITTSYNHMTIGNITINSGVTVTVNSGARWVIV